MEITLSQISAASAIFVFCSFSFYKYKKKEESNLNNIVVAVIAGGMIPLAIGFIIYPFFPEIIDPVSNKLQITIMGLVLLYVFIKTIYDKLKQHTAL